MIDFIKNIPIKNKIIYIIVIITVMVLVTGLTIQTYDTIKRNKLRVLEETRLIAKLIGEYSISALDFNYPETAEKVLAKVNTIPNVTFAALLDTNNIFFASYINTKTMNLDFNVPDFSQRKSFSEYNSDLLIISEPIYFQDKFFGSIIIQKDTKLSEIREFAVKTSVVILFAMVIIAIILASFLQKIISTPILKLSSLSSEISETGNYNLRIKRNSNDEIGILYDKFNEMLDVIHKREEELKESEEKFKNIFHNQHDGVVLHHVDGTMIDCNDTYLEMLGISYTEAFKYTIRDLSSDKLKDYDLGELWNKVYNGEPQEVEWISKNPHTNKEFNSQVNLKRVHHGKEDIILAIVRDITERKKAEVALKDLRNYLINIINSMPSVIIGIDEKINVILWNKITEEETGLTADFVNNKNLYDVFPKLNKYQKEIENSLINNKIISIPRIVTEKNNEKKYEDLTIYPLDNILNKSVVIRLDDITEHVRMEDMMVQSEKMLSVGGLAAGMAHEINNPLAGILQNSQVLKNRLTNTMPVNKRVAEQIGIDIDKLNEYYHKRKIGQFLDDIIESGSRAAVIVKNMLSFARKSEKIFSSYDMRQLIDETIELAKSDYDLKKNYDFKHINIDRNYDDDLPLVTCESSKIQQVYLNLLKNAAEELSIKGTFNDNDPKITINIFKEDKYITTEVIDNGKGIPEHVRKRIFEPFYTTKPVGQGTGLGLSVSYFIITENHSGIMDVESSENLGTKFIIKLPVEKNEL